MAPMAPMWMRRPVATTTLSSPSRILPAGSSDSQFLAGPLQGALRDASLVGGDNNVGGQVLGPISKHLLQERLRVDPAGGLVSRAERLVQRDPGRALRDEQVHDALGNQLPRRRPHDRDIERHDFWSSR